MKDDLVQWESTSDKLPPEEIPVLTISASGCQRTMKRKGQMWFYPDMAMYVYYKPVFWRLVESKQ